MSGNNGISIERIIIHKVDHRNYDAAQLSDLESPLSPEVASFMRHHILTNREHRYARTATFDENGSRPGFQPVCDALLGKPAQFVAHSRTIAQQLFDTVKNDRRISPSDLVVCTFREANSLPWLALLKMDPEDGFVGEQEIIEGKVRIVLKRVADVLPSGELQKCAFILPRSMRGTAGYDLKVLDQQATRYGGRKMIASFFTKDFLHCKVALNREETTRSFIYGSHEWVAKKTGEWPEEDVERFKNQAASSVQAEMVDVLEFARATIPDEQEQEDFVAHLRRQGLEELTFEPDSDERRRLTQYVWFEGDNGLRIRINADAVGEGRTLAYVKDKATNTWRITIRTTQWVGKAK